MRATRYYGYSIDAANALDSVDEPWLAFARENGAPELTRDAILGRAIEEFIAGIETRRLYGILFERVRSERVSVAVPYRCDSPRSFRFMELCLDPGGGGRIHMRGRLLREEPRPTVSMLEGLRSGVDYAFPLCSLCKRIMVFGEWMQPEEAVARTDMFGSGHAPALEYVVCDPCEASIRFQESA